MGVCKDDFDDEDIEGECALCEDREISVETTSSGRGACVTEVDLEGANALVGVDAADVATNEVVASTLADAQLVNER